MTDNLRAMPYYGGKAGWQNGDPGGWIARSLPWEKRSTYIEPFAGMLGVLLRRKPVHLEVVNDLDHRVVNWWRVVRDHPDELERLLSATPHSRVEFERCLEDTEDEIEAARRFTVIVTQSANSGTATKPGNWMSKKGLTATAVNYASRIPTLAERIRKVQLENTDAIKLLDRVSDMGHAVIYCDPPYTTANITAYAISRFDKGAMVDVLRAQKGSVAISGYNDEWDELGWRCEEKSTQRIDILGKSSKRTEKLWMNYPAVDRKGLFGV